MNSKPVLSLVDVHRMLGAAQAEAQRNNWNVSICVVDDGGHPLGLLRLDGSAPISAYIAQEKARTSALGRRESRDYEEMINSGRTAFVSAPLLTPLEGGVPILIDGQTLGAVGVSGVSATQDAQIAKAAIASLNS